MPPTLFLMIPFSLIVVLDQYMIIYIYTIYVLHILYQGKFFRSHTGRSVMTVELPASSPIDIRITQLPHVNRCGEVHTLPQKG